MNWITLRSGIKAAIVSATGLREQDVFFEGDKTSTGWHGPSSVGWGALPSLPPCTAELKIRQVKSSGLDEYRRAYVSTPSPTRTSAIVGSRRVLLQIKIESAQSTDGLNCFQVEGLLRARLRRKAVIAALQTAGLGQGQLGAAIAADYVDLGRQMSCCIVELPLWAAEIDLDDTAGSSDWIESARATGTVEKPTVTVDTDQVHSDGTITPV